MILRNWEKTWKKILQLNVFTFIKLLIQPSVIKIEYVVKEEKHLEIQLFGIVFIRGKSWTIVFWDMKRNLEKPFALGRLYMF